jgi:hypothetical protein
MLIAWLHAIPQERTELYNVIDVDDALPGLVALDSDMSALDRAFHSVSAYPGETRGLADWNTWFR